MSWLQHYAASYDSWKGETPPEYEGESAGDDTTHAQGLCPQCKGWCMSRVARERSGVCTQCEKRARGTP
jgi:hypothetical protein